jgi:pseudaminic acid biosynthesis-associated methylase
METNQMNFWSGDFGRDYTERNSPKSLEVFNQSYIDRFGVSRFDMFESFIGELHKDSKILEVGCNIGMQLRALQQLGFKNLYGIELQWYAVEKAKASSELINIIQGSAFDLPFKDNYFDLVMTNGVLIHISPDDLPKAISEIIRCSKSHILGFEYFSEDTRAVNYRGHQGFLWKSNFAKHFLNTSKKVSLQKEILYPYLLDAEQGNVDHMYLLKKENG